MKTFRKYLLFRTVGLLSVLYSLCQQPERYNLRSVKVHQLLPPLTEVVPEASHTDLLGFVHADDGILDGILELSTSLVCSVNQLEGPTEPLPGQSS